MLSLYIEKFISFCVIMLLLWFDFHRNILCLCYSIKKLSLWYSSRNSSQIDMKYLSCLNPTYLMLHRCLETLRNIFWFSPLQKLAKINIICILNFNLSLRWLVGRKSPVFSRFSPYSIFLHTFLLVSFS